MKNFNLYQSGILRTKLQFNQEFTTYSEWDLYTHEFNSHQPVTEEIIQRYIKEFNFNLKTLALALRDGESGVFNPPQGKLISGTQNYKKHSDYDYMYAAMKGKFLPDISWADGAIRAFTVTALDIVCVCVEEGYEDYTPIKLWKEKYANEVLYKLKSITRVDIPMRDGVKLATEILLPDTDHKVSTIFIRTPYGREQHIPSYYKYVLRGYAVCIQDVRGRNDSEGEFLPKYNEMNDGDDSLTFLAQQEWSNEQIGMFGGSYLGCVQWCAASSGNPYLKAIISLVASGDSFVDLPRKGGTFSSGGLAWTFAIKDKVYQPQNMHRDDWDIVLATLPIKEIPQKILGEEIPFWTKWCSHEEYGPFWEPCSWSKRRNKITAPAMIVSGWYDDNGDATTLAVEIANSYEDKNKRIILGPWLHSGNATRTINELELGTNALRYDLDLLYTQWFDNKLRGIANGVDKTENIEYYIVGANKWRTAKKWFPEDTSPKNYYLSHTSKANTSQGGGILSIEQPQQEYKDYYVFDPRDPAEHLIEIAENEITAPADYQEVEKREDMLIYTTAPFIEETTIAGAITVVFHAASSAKDTDWVVRLTEVDVEGRSIRLCDGILRAKFRKGFDKIVLLEPNVLEEYSITTTKIANAFKPGTRLRLQITSGAKNYIFPNHNTGNNMFTDTEMLICTQTIISSDKNPSYVILPVINK